MKNLYKFVTIFLAVIVSLTAITSEKAYATDKTSRTSALLAVPQIQTPRQMEKDNRAEILKTYLETYNSPLASHAETFIKEADNNSLDWRLVPAITGVESYFGQMIPPYSYNGWGYGVYGTNVRRFASWDEGIAVVSKALRNEYMDGRGATNVYEIGSTYAADRMWANKVQRFMDEIDAYTARFDAPSVSISL